MTGYVHSQEDAVNIVLTLCLLGDPCWDQPLVCALCVV